MTAKYIALSGGVGGAKLAYGLARLLPADELLIVANTGDDFDHLGLRICPDLDTLMYTLAGCANRELGWGHEDERWTVMTELAALGGPAWFRLGDRDLATHFYRTERLRRGASLSEATAELCRARNIAHSIVPMSDDAVATRVLTEDGELEFQHYFVREGCRPAVRGFRFDGARQASIQAELLEWLEAPDLAAVIVCPSNPFVSIGPILAIGSLKERLRASGVPVVVVSPIVGGRAIKGPTAKMMKELGMPTTTLEVARIYSDLATNYVIDPSDAADVSSIRELGFDPLVCPTLMATEADKMRLAGDVLASLHG